MNFLFVFLIVLLLFFVLVHRWKQTGSPPLSSFQKTIFVSIASYRDPECAYTLLSLFKRAMNPLCIFVGVCQQNNVEEDGDIEKQYKQLCIQENQPCFSLNNIRMLRLSHKDAKGPMYARSLIEQHLFQGEHYYMIIDSHTQFTQHWDVNIVNEFNQLVSSSKKPVLTAYALPYDRNQRDEWIDVHMKKRGQVFQWSNWTSLKLPHLKPVSKPQEKPTSSIGWAAGFSFSLSSMLQEVPYDPHCDFVFLGEEISMAARLYTHGFDLFSPVWNHVYTLWNRDYRKTFWEQLRIKKETIGYKRLKHILRFPEACLDLLTVEEQHPDPQTYGLGSDRSLEQYFSSSKVNWLSQQFL